jgi:two-component system, cell cycle sensor histidine kinase DivJ
VSFHVRCWPSQRITDFLAGRVHPTGHGDDIAAIHIFGSLISAIALAGAIVLTGSFGVAALTAIVLYAVTAVAALHRSHRLTRAALDESRAAYRLVADNTSDVILRHDANGKITFASAAATALLGVAPSRLVRHGLAAAMRPADAARCHDAIAECLDVGAPVSVEIEIVPQVKTSTPKWLELRCAPLSAGDGVVVVMRDVTTRKWHALAMKQARDEAESASRAKSSFIATISHELRTPLNAIIGFSELLHRELLLKSREPRQAEYSRIIHDSGQHLMSLVKDLLDVSKIEAGKLTICSEPFRIRDVIKSSVDTLHPAATAKSIAIDVSISSELDEVIADRRACKQMLMNLLSNACKFTPAGGTIQLSATTANDQVVLSVRDSGIGISAEHVARLGQPFYQVDSSYTRQLEGAGLGLAIVRGLVELHNGRLEIESEPGNGSCFKLILPIDTEAATAMALRPIALVA